MALFPLGSNLLTSVLPRGSAPPQAAPTAEPGDQFNPTALPQRDLDSVAQALRGSLHFIPQEEWQSLGQLLEFGPQPGQTNTQNVVAQAMRAVGQGQAHLSQDIFRLSNLASEHDLVALTSSQRQAAQGFEKHYQGLPLYARGEYSEGSDTKYISQLPSEVFDGQLVSVLLRDNESGRFIELRGKAGRVEDNRLQFSLDGQKFSREHLIMAAVLPEARASMPVSTPAAPLINPVIARPVSATTLARFIGHLPQEERLPLLEKAGVKPGQKGDAEAWMLGQYLAWLKQGDSDIADQVLKGDWKHLNGKNTLEAIPQINSTTSEFYAQSSVNESSELFPQDLREAVGKRVSVLRYQRDTMELQVLEGTLSRAAGSSFGLREFPQEDFNRNSDRLVILTDQVGSPEKADPLTFQVGNAEVHGHWIDDVDHRHYASSRYTIRTYAPDEKGKVASIDFRQLLESQRRSVYPSVKYVVPPESVAESVTTTGKLRQQQLENPDQLQTGQRVVPKDASLRASHYNLYVGETKDPSGQFALQMSQIGQLEDFQVIAGVSGFLPELENQPNLSQMQVPHGEAWAEDVSEGTLGGGQVVPAIFEDKEPAISALIVKGRQQRYGEMDTNLFGTHGMVNDDHLQEFGLARASLTGPARQALSYIEGGNMYTGTRADGRPYALVGKDSVHVTKMLLERQSGREWSAEEVHRAIAADLGVKPEEVFAIEQPGAFHLDLRLTSLAPGEIVLNDAKAAAEQQIAWMNEALEEQVKAGLTTDAEVETRRLIIDHQAGILRDRAEQLAPFEDMAAQDLAAAGLKVHRVGAAFIDPTNTWRDRSNFFNARHGTNQQGQRYAILMGAEAHEEAYVAQKFFEFAQGTVSRLHFLDPAVTAPTLAMYGGLKCRTKPEGELATELNFFPLRTSS